MGLWAKVFNIMVALLLALGWKWIEVLETHNWMVLDQTKKAWYLTILTAALFLQQTLLAIPKPASMGFVHERKDIVEEYLTQLLLNYEDTVFKLTGNAVASSDIRATVMLPTRGFFGLLNTHLMVYYHASLSHSAAIPTDEISLKWSKKHGLCGSVWRTKQTLLYDADNPQYQAPSKTLTQKQQTAVGRLKSILGVPIVNKGKVVGVLCMDSERNIQSSLLDNRKVALLASACAERLRAQCSEYGVKT